MSFESLLDSTVDIKQVTETADSDVGYTDTWTTLYWNVPCKFESLDQGAGRLEVQYGKRVVYPRYYVYMSHRDIKEGHRLYLPNGNDFEVVLVENWAEQNKYLRLACIVPDRNA